MNRAMNTGWIALLVASMTALAGCVAEVGSGDPSGKNVAATVSGDPSTGDPQESPHDGQSNGGQAIRTRVSVDTAHCYGQGQPWNPACGTPGVTGARGIMEWPGDPAAPSANGEPGVVNGSSGSTEGSGAAAGSWQGSVEPK
jgi:hypothetical protein